MTHPHDAVVADGHGTQEPSVHCDLFADAREYYCVKADGTHSPRVRVPFGMFPVDTAVIGALWLSLEPSVSSPQEEAREPGVLRLLP